MSQHSLPAPPPAAAEIFGDRLPHAVRYAELLADVAVSRGLIGPREVPRLWERHLLNCAALAEIVPPRVAVCDIGSGAGLPGIPVALVRPDLRITLLEPLLRRTTFLNQAVELLGLEDQVTVVRGRAEEVRNDLAPADVVTARAVAPLDRLAGWGLPLLQPHGEMLAIKGESAAEELRSAHAALTKLGMVRGSVVRVGGGLLDPPCTVARVEVGEGEAGRRGLAAKRGKATQRRQRADRRR